MKVNESYLYDNWFHCFGIRITCAFTQHKNKKHLSILFDHYKELSPKMYKLNQ